MEQRTGRDRRKHPRGGRRPNDQRGHSPLVMVIESDRGRREMTEAILAKLQFAVVPVESVEQAVEISKALRPNVIVCDEADARSCDGRLPSAIPLVSPTEQPDTLVEQIRKAIRAAKVVPFG